MTLKPWPRCNMGSIYPSFYLQKEWVNNNMQLNIEIKKRKERRKEDWLRTKKHEYMCPLFLYSLAKSEDISSLLKMYLHYVLKTKCIPEQSSECKAFHCEMLGINMLLYSPNSSWRGSHKIPSPGYRNSLPLINKHTSEVKHWCLLAPRQQTNSSLRCLVGLGSGLSAGQ